MNYLMGGKLGDFIHSMAVCKYIYEITSQKANVFIANVGDSFEHNVEFTYNELKPILEKQDWLDSFKVYDNSKIDIDLNQFRNSPLLNRTNWLEIYFNRFLINHNPPKEYTWIDMEKDPRFEKALIVNRSTVRTGNKMSEITNERFIEISSKYQEKYFICFNVDQYNNFQYKDTFQLLLVNNLYEYFKFINSANLFIGNQSAPFAMASSMNVPRVLEILRHKDNSLQCDGYHYYNDINYYQNFWII